VVVASFSKKEVEVPRTRVFTPPPPPGLRLGELKERLLEKHPDWRVERNWRAQIREAHLKERAKKRGENVWIVDTSFDTYCYFVCGHDPELKMDAEAWLPVLKRPASLIDQYPFEEKTWKGRVFVRLLRVTDRDDPGWYGQSLIKEFFMFYGDQAMVKQIEKDLD
jgi:hypothetical protein